MNDIDPALLEQITREAESRNRDFYPDGTPVRSSAGALFGMQVLPSTAGRPGYGVAPASSQTPGEYNRVGLDLLKALNRKYGDPRTAWAAYNWGPGKVDRAQGRYGSDWLAHAPGSVRAYANNNAAKLSASAPTPSAQPGTAAMDDEYTPPLSATDGIGLSRESWWKDYQKTQSEAAQLAADAAAQRKQQYEQGLAALQNRQWGPSTSEKLAAWSAALLSPTRVPGFKGTMMNLAPMMQELAQQRRTAEQQRADAMQALQDKYLNGTLENRDAALQARRAALKDAATMLNQPGADYSATPTGVIFNKRTGFPVPAPSHVNGLLANPSMARDFDIKFGPGAAEEILKRYGGQQ